MAQMCDVCGLPDELCVCEDVSKDEQRIDITTETRTHGKTVTIVSGFDTTTIDLDSLSSELKSTLACGGSTKNDSIIELQGDHVERLHEYLEDNGYTVSTAVA